MTAKRSIDPSRAKRLLVSSLASTAMLAGCTKIQPPTVLPKYYVSSVGMQHGAGVGNVDNQVQQLVDTASKILRKGKTVAFYPPDQCRNTNASQHGAKEEGFLGMECGVLMSSLETNAAAAGYVVVSWQMLKKGDVLAAAKSLKVDVLFEIDQLSAGDRDAPTAKMTSIEFSQQTSPSDRRSLVVAQQTGHTCKAMVDAVIAAGTDKNAKENSATLATKAVQVKTGRAIWYYKKTVQEQEDEGTAMATDMYFRAQPMQDLSRHKKHNTMQVFGGVFLPLSVPIVGAGAGLTAVGSGPGKALLGVGIPLFVVGVGLLVTGNLFAKKKNQENAVPRIGPDHMYPSPDQILCVTTPVSMPFQTAPTPEQIAATTAQQQGSSSFQFSESTSGASDPERARKERLIRLAATDFVNELNKLVEGEPQAEPAEQ